MPTVCEDFSGPFGSRRPEGLLRPRPPGSSVFCSPTRVYPLVAVRVRESSSHSFAMLVRIDRGKSAISKLLTEKRDQGRMLAILHTALRLQEHPKDTSTDKRRRKGGKNTMGNLVLRKRS